MSAHLHFIGKCYYTISTFTKEAQRIGISRRVSLADLKRMQWGDTVCCAQVERGLKSPSVFLTFPIQIITGLSGEMGKEIREELPCSIIDLGGQSVSRGCGSYISGIMCEVDAPVERLVDLIEEKEKAGMDKGDLMIGCYKEAVNVIEKPLPVFPDIPHRQGFRLFDWDQVQKEMEKFRGEGKRPRLMGQFYINMDTDQAQLEKGAVQAVHNYGKKGD